jgi:hypothetical protein
MHRFLASHGREAIATKEVCSLVLRFSSSLIACARVPGKGKILVGNVLLDIGNDNLKDIIVSFGLWFHPFQLRDIWTIT